jgi:molecular chaperone GrpE
MIKPDSPDPRQPDASAQAHSGTTTSDSSPHALAEQLADVARQRDEYLDQLQRTRAEFVNFQKRSRAQADADRQYAALDLSTDLLNVLDNFERAIDAARQAGASSIVDGLELVHRQFLAALGKHGVEPIAALGHPFDPNRHEALLQQPSADHPEGTVVAELGRGYILRDRVLRPSKVAVSTRPAG